MRNALLPIVVLSLLPGCHPPPPPVAYGDFEELHWIRDEALTYLDTTVQALFSRTYYTPHEDPLFRIIPHTPDSFLQARRGYQQMLWATLSSGRDYPAFRRLLQAEETGVVFRRNLFTTNAYVIGVAEHRPEALEYLLTRHAKAIQESLLTNVLTNLRRATYYAGRNNRLEEKIRRRYGISMEIPTGYALFLEGERAFGIAKHMPSRFLAVFRLEVPDRITPQTLIHLRDSLASRFYEGDRVIRDRVVSETLNLGGREVWVLTGPWQNETRIQGGAFRLYAWVEGDTLWLVDTGVYAPERRHKWPLLLRLQILAATVRPVRGTP